MMVHCVLNHVGSLWVEISTDNEDQVCTGKEKKPREYKILQNKPEIVNITRKLLKGDTHALV